jgi:hypothetical protein
MALSEANILNATAITLLLAAIIIQQDMSKARCGSRRGRRSGVQEPGTTREHPVPRLDPYRSPVLFFLPDLPQHPPRNTPRAPLIQPPHICGLSADSELDLPCQDLAGPQPRWTLLNKTRRGAIWICSPVGAAESRTFVRNVSSSNALAESGQITSKSR